MRVVSDSHVRPALQQAAADQGPPVRAAHQGPRVPRPARSRPLGRLQDPQTVGEKHGNFYSL